MLSAAVFRSEGFAIGTPGRAPVGDDGEVSRVRERKPPRAGHRCLAQNPKTGCEREPGVGMEVVAIVEFSGRCGNPVVVSKNLRAMGGRLASYDPGTGVVMGAFRVKVSDPGDFERKKSLFIDGVAPMVDDCRLWVRAVLGAELLPLLRKRSVMRVPSEVAELLVVKLENYVYSLWIRRGAGALRLVPVSEVARWRPGDFAEPARPCEELPGLLDSIREDLAEALRSCGE